MKHDNAVSVFSIRHRMNKDPRRLHSWSFIGRQSQDMALRGGDTVSKIDKTLPQFTVAFLVGLYKLPQNGSRGLSSQEKADRVAASRILQQLYFRDSLLGADDSSRQKCADGLADAEDGPLERDRIIVSAKSPNSDVVAAEGEVSQTLIASEESTHSKTSVNKKRETSPSEWSSPEGSYGIDRLPLPVVQASAGSPVISCRNSDSPPIGSESASPAETALPDFEVVERLEYDLNPFTTPVSRIIDFERELSVTEYEEEARPDIVEAPLSGSSIRPNHVLARVLEDQGYKVIGGQSRAIRDTETFATDPFTDQTSAAALASKQTRRRVFANVEQNPELLMRRPAEMRRPDNIQGLGRAGPSLIQGPPDGPHRNHWRKNSATILQSPLFGHDMAVQTKKELEEEKFASSIQHVCFVPSSTDHHDQRATYDFGFSPSQRLPQSTQAPPPISFDGSHASAIWPINNAPTQTGTASNTARLAAVGSELAWPTWQHPTRDIFQHSPNIHPSGLSPSRTTAAPIALQGLKILPTNIGTPAFQGIDGLSTQASAASNFARVGTAENEARATMSTQDSIPSTHPAPNVTSNTYTNADTDAHRAHCMYQDLQFAKIAETFYGRDRNNRVCKTARNW